MILKAKHHPFIYPFFQRYTLLIMKRKFSPIYIIGEFRDNELPVLLISNHISWWDGFWAMYLNLKVFKRRFHFMMLEEQLRKFWFFNYSGGYSVNRNSRTILETICYTVELLKDKNNMVLIFPQGEIQSMHKQLFTFEKGLESILKKVENEIQIVFSGNMVDYFSKSKPGLYLHIKNYTGKSNKLEDIMSQYDEFYKECIDYQWNLTK